MSSAIIQTVFFDLGDTLGTPELTPPPMHLARFHIFPFALTVLNQLTQRGLRLGIISNTGDDKGSAVNVVLAASGILSYFEPNLCIYSADVGMSKDNPEIFRLAASRAGAATGSCLFVGEDAHER